jgi:plasmid stabilization system protein ParE
MAYRVSQTDQAHADLDDILLWLVEQKAGEAGLRWFNRLEDAIETLCEYPQRCAIASESEDFRFEVRQLIHGRKPHQYKVLFAIEGDIVVVLHIRHGRRLPVAPKFPLT